MKRHGLRAGAGGYSSGRWGRPFSLGLTHRLCGQEEESRLRSATVDSRVSVESLPLEPAPASVRQDGSAPGQGSRNRGQIEYRLVAPVILGVCRGALTGRWRRGGPRTARARPRTPGSVNRREVAACGDCRSPQAAGIEPGRPTRFDRQGAFRRGWNAGRQPGDSRDTGRATDAAG